LVGGEDDSVDGGWPSGDVPAVAAVDAVLVEEVGVASGLECPEFAVGCEGVGVEVGEDGGGVGVLGGEDDALAAADFGDWSAAYSGGWLAFAGEFLVGDESACVLFDELALPGVVVCHC
jgi:hypothetical protein